MILPILAALPLFFDHIEARQGVRLNDVLLNHIPAQDLSVFIFTLIWGMGALFLWRSLNNPELFIKFTWSYLLTCVFRVCTIYFIPLDPPQHIKELADPLTGVFYGHMDINKDLFFSGHTSILFLMFLTIPDKKERWLALVITILVAIMLLIQHVHYTIDIIAAPLFAYIAFVLAENLTGKLLQQSK